MNDHRAGKPLYAEPQADNRTNEIADRTRRWFHRLAWLTACLCFPLIWIGGLVTTTDAGMAVPDWPGTYGYNMFAYPLSTWFFGPWDLFLEHGHRLLASLVGLVCIGWFAMSCLMGSGKWRWLSGLALVLVIFQGVLGGLRVVLDARTVAMIHGCMGPGFFAYVVGLVVVSSSWWQRIGETGSWISSHRDTRALNRNDSDRLGRIWERLWTARSVAVVTVVLAYAQLALGANLRHISESADPSQYRVLVWFHVLTALAVMVGAVLLVSRPVGPVPGLRRSRWFLITLVGLQILLGLGTWVVKFGWPAWFQGMAMADQFRIQEKQFWQVTLVTAHVAVGSLILATTVWCTVRLWRAEHSAGRLLEEWGHGPWQTASKRHLPVYHAGTH